MSDDSEKTEGEGEASKTRPVLNNPLSRDSDQAVRPGFRSPPNKGSKAQRSAKKGKKK